MSGIGTMSYEDIYGAGSLDTLPAGVVGETQKKTNPNDSEVTGSVAKDKAGLLHMKGKLLGQPLTAWFGMLLLLVLAKFLVENKA